MKRYRDEYDDDSAEAEEVYLEQKSEVAVDRLALVDYVIALILGSGVFALLMIWPFPILEPGAWQDVAEAAGVRAPQNLLPGLWRAMVAPLFKLTSVASGIAGLQLLGKVAVGGCTALAYLTFREILSLTIRLRLQYSVQRYVAARLAASLGAVLFACSDPVWHAAQTFSPVTFLLFLALVCLYLFFAFLQRGSLLLVYAAMFCFGVLSSETPLGFVLLAFCWGVYFMAVRRVLSFEMPLLNPFIEQVSKWHMTFLFVVGLLGGILANCASYSALGGLSAMGLGVGDLPLCYALRMWELVTSAGSLMGWIIAFGVVVVPTVIAAVLLPRAADEEMFLPYHVGAVYLFTGLLALAQFCQVDALWFWTWISRPEMIPSSFLLCVFMFALAATLVFALAVLGIDALCRDHRRLALQRYADLRQDIEQVKTVVSPGMARWMRRMGSVALPLVVLAAVVPGRRLVKAREMMDFVRAYAQEVLAECGPVKWIFTDGAYDPLLEVMAAAEGRVLRPLSMLASGDRYARYLRARDASDAEDRLSLEVGAPMALRSWVRDRKDHLGDFALQLGFEIWKRDGKALPSCSGVLSRPVGMTDEECARGVANARALGGQILDFYAKGGPARNAGTKLNELFVFVQWRIARLARMRAEQADVAGNAALAIEDVRISEKLDDTNASLKRILEGMEKMRALVSRQITPREGLQMALTRADFALARRYAEPILQADPDEPQANFGMGMSYFVQEQWARAEEYLSRCLVRNPKEPAIYNNLAVLQTKVGRFDAAEKNAKRALELVPDSAEVKDTLKMISKAREDALARERKAKKRAEEARRRAAEDS